jgi:hypothetical protein
VCGDSGNDEEMLRGEPKAVVVGNYSHELEGAEGQPQRLFRRKALCRRHSGRHQALPIYRKIAKEKLP